MTATSHSLHQSKSSLLGCLQAKKSPTNVSRSEHSMCRSINNKLHVHTLIILNGLKLKQFQPFLFSGIWCTSGDEMRRLVMITLLPPHIATEMKPTICQEKIIPKKVNTKQSQFQYI